MALNHLVGVRIPVPLLKAVASFGLQALFLLDIFIERFQRFLFRTFENAARCQTFFAKGNLFMIFCPESAHFEIQLPRFSDFFLTNY